MEQGTISTRDFGTIAACLYPESVGPIDEDVNALRAIGRSTPIPNLRFPGSHVEKARKLTVRGIEKRLAKESGCPVQTIRYILASDGKQRNALKRALALWEYHYEALLNFKLFGERVVVCDDALMRKLVGQEDEKTPVPALRAEQSSLVILSGVTAVNALYLTVLGGCGKNKLDDSVDGVNYDASVFAFATIFEPDARIHARRLTISAFHADSSRVYCFLRKALALVPGRSLDDALDTDWDKFVEHDGQWDSLSKATVIGAGEQQLPDTRERQHLLRVVAKCLDVQESF